jgi:hypothetical protein
MVTRAIAIMAAVFLFTGCGKKQEASAPVTQPQAQPVAVAAPSATQPEAPASVIAPVVVSQSKTNAYVAPDLGSLSRAVRTWGLQHAGMPSSFEEFAADPGPGVVIPPPPPGKKYAFDHKKHVILVNR